MPAPRDARTQITVHGEEITLYARERDSTTITIRVGSGARSMATLISHARLTRSITTDMPLLVVMLVWAWNGTGTLQDDSWEKYRSNLPRILRTTGATLLENADHDWYVRFHAALLEPSEHDPLGATCSTLEAIATVVGSCATWVLENSGYDGPRIAGEGSLRNVHRRFRSLARAAHKTTSPKIRATHCPSLEEILAFGVTLGELAARRWGEEYRCWQHAPLMQFVTGARLMELPVLTVESFDFDDLRDAWVAIDFQYRDGAHTPGSPNLGPTKNKKPRTASLWWWVSEHLAPILAEAEGRPGKLLLPIPPHLKTGKRRLQDLYNQAIVEHGYQWTSHWHRHAYVSWNLATRAESGYGRSPAAVAEWIGHYDTGLIERRYWVKVATTPDSSHLPGCTPIEQRSVS